MDGCSRAKQTLKMLVSFGKTKPESKYYNLVLGAVIFLI